MSCGVVAYRIDLRTLLVANRAVSAFLQKRSSRVSLKEVTEKGNVRACAINHEALTCRVDLEMLHQCVQEGPTSQWCSLVCINEQLFWTGYSTFRLSACDHARIE